MIKVLIFILTSTSYEDKYIVMKIITNALMVAWKCNHPLRNYDRQTDIQTYRPTNQQMDMGVIIRLYLMI